MKHVAGTGEACCWLLQMAARANGGFTSCGILMSLYGTRHHERGRAGGWTGALGASLLLCYNLNGLAAVARILRSVQPQLRRIPLSPTSVAHQQQPLAANITSNAQLPGVSKFATMIEQLQCSQVSVRAIICSWGLAVRLCLNAAAAACCHASKILAATHWYPAVTAPPPSRRRRPLQACPPKAHPSQHPRVEAARC